MVKKRVSVQLAKEAFSNLFKKSSTQKYPSVPASVAEKFRGKQVLDLDKCIGCTLCGKECPAKAIDFVIVQGKKLPVIHLDKCVFCYQCADTCPRGVFKTSKDFELATIDKNSLVLNPVASVSQQ
jgi:formate hydrogenlyase subunit 6/NADH:ubiquinone oxidoreductase subunit I